MSIDLEMADVGAIDDGATIIGLLNEQMRIKQAQDELTEALTTIAQERREKQAQAQRIAELEAEMALFKNMHVQTPKKPQSTLGKKSQATAVTPSKTTKAKGTQKSADGGSTKVDSGGSSSARRP